MKADTPAIGRGLDAYARDCHSSRKMAEKSARARLDAFISRYSRDVAATARAAFLKMRRRLPGAVVLVYDNYNALAIGFGPTERASDAIVSLALFPRWVSLFFLQSGAAMTDPLRLLKGTGKRARHIVLSPAADLDAPAVESLIVQALALASSPIDRKGRGRIVIKSVSATQRPRRPSATPRKAPASRVDRDS